MSKFYTEIAKYYEDIFPVGNAKINLIQEIAGRPPKNILDVACGSGGYSKELKNKGYEITAIDLDEKMIADLKEKDKEVDARVLNMQNIEALDKKFDLIFCIGNSLVHLKDNEEVYSFLKQCNESLQPKGHLLLQIINYDRVLEKDIKSLPTINNKDVNLSFERYYDYLPDKHKVDFKTILKVEGKELENHVLLHPIKSEELIALLEKSGFHRVKTYGNFKKDKYDSMESVPLIILAKKE